MDFQDMLTDIFTTIFFILQFLYFGIPFGLLVYISVRRWREKTGPNLIAIGTYESKIIKYIALFLFLNVLSVLGSIIANRDFSLQKMTEIVFWGVLTIGLFSSATRKVYVLNDGISQFHLQRTRWAQIGSYFWDDRDENRLLLFKKGGGKIDFTISPEDRERLNTLLQTNLSNQQASSSV